MIYLKLLYIKIHLAYGEIVIEHLEQFQPLFYATFRGQNSQSNDIILKPSKTHF